MDKSQKVKELLQKLHSADTCNLITYYQIVEVIDTYSEDENEKRDFEMELKKEAPTYGISTSFLYEIMRTCRNIPYDEYKKLDKQAKKNNVRLTWTLLRHAGRTKLPDVQRVELCKEIVSKQYTEREVKRLVYEITNHKKMVSLKGWTRIPPDEKFIDEWFVYTFKGYRYVEQLTYDKSTDQYMLGQNSIPFLLKYNTYFYKLPELVVKEF